MSLLTSLLSPITSILTYLHSFPLHATYFPYPLFMVLHAMRISLPYQIRARMTQAVGVQMPLSQELGGYLLMCWGGGLLSSFLLMQVPPPVYSTAPWICYSVVHLALSSLKLPLSPSLLDTIFPPLDGLLRSGAVVAGVQMVLTHPNPIVSNSLWAQLLIAAASSAGGGIIATTVGIWDLEWGIRTPMFLKRGSNGFIATLEIWSGAVAAAIYGFLTMSNPGYSQVYHYFGIEEKRILMSPMEARAVIVLFLSGCYSFRAYMVHWAAKKAVASQKSSANGSSKKANGTPKKVNGSTEKDLKEKKSQ